MIPACLIVGDSIAIGTTGSLATRGIHCAVHARIGAASGETMRTPPRQVTTRHVILSLGSNDADDPNLGPNLVAVRRRVSAQRVTWIIPYHPRASRIVRMLARGFGDTMLDLGRFASRDGIHPTTYAGVAQALDWRASQPADAPQVEVRTVRATITAPAVPVRQAYASGLTRVARVRRLFEAIPVQECPFALRKEGANGAHGGHYPG